MKNYGKPQYECILFDLDETLYPKESGLMDAIGERISHYMTQKVGIPADDVALKHRTYYQQYGTALGGLIVEYNIAPADYLAYIHDVNPQDFFGISPPLDNMLRDTPLRKVIFTNADAPHSERVLNTLQVRSHFEMIIDINTINFRSKPDPWAYRRTLEILGVPGESCIMVDDKIRNLIPAKDLGMTTILVDSTCNSIAVDYTVPTVFHVENILRQLLPAERY